MEIFTSDNLIWTLFAAALAAIVFSYFMQRTLSGLAKRIIKANACSEETALTLSRLGYKNAVTCAAAKFFAYCGSPVSRAIKKTEPKKTDGGDDMMFSEKEEIKYYIPEENMTESFSKQINDTLSFPKLVLLAAILTALAFAARPAVKLFAEYAESVVERDGGGSVGADGKDNALLDEQEKLNRIDEEEKRKQEQLEALEKQAEEEKKLAEEAKQTAENGGGQE